MNQNEIEEIKESIRELLLFRRVIILGIISVLLGYGIYLLVNYYGVGSHVMDWIHLVFRWAHVVLGISWIGASFYFIFLENSLNRTDNLRDELAGNLWAIHGGGFYYVEKYKIAPGELPKKLHWFKYEAYFTWLTGIILLLLVYYFNAKTFMVDPAVATISPATSILIGSGTLIFGWFIYDFLCRTPFIQKKKSFAVLGFLIVTAISFFLSQFLSGRAAFIHVGALIGTIMAGNVFFVIIPAQKAMVKAAKLGQPLNPELGKYAGLRSLHNNYMTLPVIFIMLSNHFPATFGNAFNWAVLAGLTLASVAVRHCINLHEKGQHAAWMIPFAVIALIALIIVTAPVSTSKKSTKPVAFSQVQPIFKKRCQSCHSAAPTDEVQTIAPGGVLFDTPEQIHKMSERILVRAVQTKTMPQANKTGITDEERELIGSWIEQGAKIEN